MQIEISYPIADEFKFIIDSWSSSYRKSRYAGTVPNNMWAEVSRASISQLMLRDKCEVMVALAPRFDDTNPRRIMGYIAGEPGILHWVYTKKDFRRLGIASQLLTKLCSNWEPSLRKFPRYTHKTDASDRFLPNGWKWDTIPARVKA